MRSESQDDNPYKTPAELEASEAPAIFRGELRPHRGKTVYSHGLWGLLLGLTTPISLVFLPFLPLIGFFLCLNAIRWAKIDLERMKCGEMDPTGEALTRKGQLLARWGIV